MKYGKFYVNNVLKNSDILAVALCSDNKLIKALPNDRYSIVCVFHDDKKPSMILDRKNNRFYCHGCLKNGDSSDLIRNIYQIDFLASIEILAAAFNVELPYRRYVNIDYKIVDQIKSNLNSMQFDILCEKSKQKTLKK